MHKLIHEIEAFQAAAGLKDHRVGMVLANNGRLLERLRADKPMLTSTIAKIRENLSAQYEMRGLSLPIEGRDAEACIQDGGREKAAKRGAA